MRVWFDVKMDDRSQSAMRDGVCGSDCVIAVITGPCANADSPDDPPEANAYFRREYCLAELRWAKEAGVRIQPVIRAADKGRIGELMALAPDDLKFIGGIDFITLDRSDKDYWSVGVEKILKAAGKAVRRVPAGADGGVIHTADPRGGRRCTLCSEAAGAVCTNCREPVCNIHASEYTERTNLNTGETEIHRVCDTCHELFRITDKIYSARVRTNVHALLRGYMRRMCVCVCMCVSKPGIVRLFFQHDIL